MASTRFSISVSRAPNRLNASCALASDVHSLVSRWPRYTSSEEWLDRISSSEMPTTAWNWAVMERTKNFSGFFSSSLYASEPGTGMGRRLTDGRFGWYPQYGYCPKLTAACSADAIQMMVVQAFTSSGTVCILGHQCSSLRSACPTSRASFHHACSSTSACSTPSLG
uniref:Uncharacterized protein n=1 Tax=Zea mays TaxID=4577 RepID=A0A804N9H2_MAIZE